VKKTDQADALPEGFEQTLENLERVCKVNYGKVGREAQNVGNDQATGRGTAEGSSEMEVCDPASSGLFCSYTFVGATSGDTGGAQGCRSHVTCWCAEACAKRAMRNQVAICRHSLLVEELGGHLTSLDCKPFKGKKEKQLGIQY